MSPSMSRYMDVSEIHVVSSVFQRQGLRFPYRDSGVITISMTYTHGVFSLLAHLLSVTYTRN